MKNHIKVRFYKIAKGENFNQINFQKLHISDSTIILLSRNCYTNICIEDHYVERSTSSTNKFVLQNNNYFSTSSISIKPVYATYWYLVTNIFYDEFNYCFNGEFTDEILFIYYEDEIEEKDVLTLFILTSQNENPVDFIMQRSPEFTNSIFFLTKTAYSRLKNTTNTISSYKGIERLTWELDDDFNYMGGHIMLNSMSDGNLYFIENMNFSTFTKTFYVKGLPDTIYFIL